MNKILNKSFFYIIFILISLTAAVTITGCDNPSTTPVVTPVIPVTPTNPTNPQNPESPSTPNNPNNPDSPTNPTSTPELHILTILPTTFTNQIQINTPTTINYELGSDYDYWRFMRVGNDNFGFEIAENGNPNNLNFQATPTLNAGVSVQADKAGTVTFRIYNRGLNTESRNYVSNYMTISFANTNNVAAIDTRFIGTWVTTDQYLIDTIVFNSDGTSQQYNSQYPNGTVNINWEVKSSNTIYFSGNGSSCTATFIFSANNQTLQLTNYFDYSSTLTFNKQ